VKKGIVTASGIGIMRSKVTICLIICTDRVPPLTPP
jgi:hypothetical protein